MDRNAADEVAAEVRALLARRQISGKELSNHLGMSQFSVSRRLRGETAFTITELIAVADYLQVPLAALLPSRQVPA